MQAKELSIKVKKIVFRGDRYYKVDNISCFSHEELPLKYFECFPYCAMCCSGLSVVSSNNVKDNYYITVGDIIEQEEFEKMMKVVKYCGEKLHNINQEIKEIKKTWQGDEVFKI